MENEMPPELIRKYLAGTCRPDEVDRVVRWYNSFEEDTDPLLSLSAEEKQALKEMMLSRVMENLDSMGQLSKRRKLSVRIRYYSLAGAAAVLLLFSVGLLFQTSRHSSSSENPDPVLSDQAAKGTAAEEEQEVFIRNTSKTIFRQSLPDGSVVWLKPQTYLCYPKAFDKNIREVSMRGEAFFEVSKEVSRPFVVYSGEIVTRVLGTSFNIKAYENDPSAEVSVFTGQVSVSLASDQPDAPPAGQIAGNSVMMLAKDEKAVFFQEEKRFKKQTYDKQMQPELNIWKKNSISFDNVPVKEVVQALNSEFDVTLRVHKEYQELNNYILKADFTNQNLPDILQMLEKSLNLTYEIEGKEIVLKLNK